MSQMSLLGKLNVQSQCNLVKSLLYCTSEPSRTIRRLHKQKRPGQSQKCGMKLMKTITF